MCKQWLYFKQEDATCSFPSKQTSVFFYSSKNLIFKKFGFNSVVMLVCLFVSCLFVFFFYQLSCHFVILVAWKLLKMFCRGSYRRSLNVTSPHEYSALFLFCCYKWGRKVTVLFFCLPLNFIVIFIFYLFFFITLCR